MRVLDQPVASIITALNLSAVFQKQYKNSLIIIYPVKTLCLRYLRTSNII